jgi:sulfate/thiosulfate transport system ATP-binding protein
MSPVKKGDTLYAEFKNIVVFDKNSENKLTHSGKSGIRNSLKSKLI